MPEFRRINPTAPTMKSDPQVSIISAVDEDGIGHISIWPPVECRCGHMAAFLINRHGKTLCLECDSKVG